MLDAAATRLDKARVIERAYRAWVVPALLMIALASYFLDWHIVHRTNALEGFSLFGPGSAVIPPVHDTGDAWICTGFSHYQNSLVIPLALGASLLFSLLTRARAGLLLSAGQAGATAATLFYAVDAQLLKHLFQRVETLAPEPTFFAALLTLLLGSLVNMGYRALFRVRLAERA